MRGPDFNNKQSHVELLEKVKVAGNELLVNIRPGRVLLLQAILPFIRYAARHIFLITSSFNISITVLNIIIVLKLISTV
jgi:hypothetical protein